MNAQYYFPYSILDFGLTALALIIMGVIGYLFYRFVTHQHKLSTETTNKHIEVLERIIQYTQSVTLALHEVSAELHELREDIYRNRAIIETARERIERLGRSRQGED